MSLIELIVVVTLLRIVNVRSDSALFRMDDLGQSFF